MDNKGDYQMAVNRYDFCLGALAPGVSGIGYLPVRLGAATLAVDAGSLGSLVSGPICLEPKVDIRMPGV